MVRHSIRLLFEPDEDFEVCGEAENGRQAIEKTTELRPELVIMDLSMPVLNGLDATRAIKRIKPGVPVILCSGFCCALEQKKRDPQAVLPWYPNQIRQASSRRPTRCGEQIGPVPTIRLLNRGGEL